MRSSRRRRRDGAWRRLGGAKRSRARPRGTRGDAQALRNILKPNGKTCSLRPGIASCDSGQADTACDSMVRRAVTGKVRHVARLAHIHCCRRPGGWHSPIHGKFIAPSASLPQALPKGRECPLPPLCAPLITLFDLPAWLVLAERRLAIAILSREGPNNRQSVERPPCPMPNASFV